MFNRETFLGPRFWLEAEGKLASDLIPFISSFSYEDDESKQDTFKIEVQNPGLRFKDDPRFKEGARFRLRFGYDTLWSDTKNVIIAKARPRYDQKPVISMVAFGLTKAMNMKANPKVWGDVTSTKVAEEIAKRYGFTTELEDSKDARIGKARVQPANQTDFQYLMALASQLNWDFYVEGTTLHFHKKRYDSPSVMTYRYFTDSRGTLLSFDPDVSMNAPPQTGVTGASSKDGKTKDGKDEGATKANVKKYRIIDTDARLSVGMVHEGKSPKGNSGEGGLKNPSHEEQSKIIGLHGAAAAKKIDMSAMKANAEVIGDPRLRARVNVRIEGVDAIYNGNWRVSGTKHSLSGNGKYTTSLSLKRDTGNAKNKSLDKHGKESDTNGGSTAKKGIRAIDLDLRQTARTR